MQPNYRRCGFFAVRHQIARTTLVVKANRLEEVVLEEVEALLEEVEALLEAVVMMTLLAVVAAVVMMTLLAVVAAEETLTQTEAMETMRVSAVYIGGIM